MNKIILLWIKMVSLIPMSWLNILAKKVILNNLSHSFPKNNLNHNKKILFQFYFFLGQLIVESIKLFNIKEKEIRKRITFKNSELVQSYLDQDKDVILVLGHYGNWEWGLLANSLKFKEEMIGIYKPLTSSFWNKELKKARSRFGATLLSMKESVRYLLRPNNKGRLIGIIADQTPSEDELNYWTTFLNQKTPVFLGTEKLAKKLNCPVIFTHISPIKKGYYEMEFELITDEPTALPYGSITNLHTQILENKIIDKPSYWLWSHRRWKHKQK
jgi:KDO2-lipid IV(A) lauroyltransferase